MLLDGKCGMPVSFRGGNGRRVKHESQNLPKTFGAQKEKACSMVFRPIYFEVLEVQLPRP